MRRFAALLTLTATVSAFAQGPYRSSITYDSYEGLVMAGYQGWFNTPGDGAGRNWHHYEKGRRFEPGWCTIDLWPEVDEYPQLYETAFRFEDGTPAYVPSPYDKSTVDVHFRWMKEYGLDGVFLQRFIAEIANPSGKKHFNKVMDSAMECANKYDRAVAIMYDLTNRINLRKMWPAIGDADGNQTVAPYSLKIQLKAGYTYWVRMGVQVNDTYTSWNLSEVKKIVVPE